MAFDKVTLDKIYNDPLYAVLFPKPEFLMLREPNETRIKKGTMLDLSSKPDLQEIMEKEWDARVKEAQEKGNLLFSGPQFRLSNYRITHSASGNILVLELAPSNYKELLGTNGLAFGSVAFPGRGKDLYQKFLEDGKKEGKPYKYLSGVLAVCVAIESSDGYMLVMKRAANLAEYADALHTIGGHPRPQDFQPEGQEFNPDKIYPELIDFDKAVAHEIKAEVGLDREDYQLQFVALVRNEENGKPELVFSAMSNKTLKEILEQPRVERGEAVEFKGLMPEEIQDLLETGRNICPPGKAALDMHLYLRD